jgi:hypothetical protein
MTPEHLQLLLLQNPHKEILVATKVLRVVMKALKKAACNCISRNTKTPRSGGEFLYI